MTTLTSKTFTSRQFNQDASRAVYPSVIAVYPPSLRA